MFTMPRMEVVMPVPPGPHLHPFHFRLESAPFTLRFLVTLVTAN